MPTVLASRAPFRVASVAVAAGALVFLPVVPAHATTVVTTAAQLVQAVGTPSGTVVLGADITVNDPLEVLVPVRVDLAGHLLSTQAVILADRLTIDDSSGAPGTWTADARTHNDAAFRTTGTVLVIERGTVVAYGDQNAAGIGAKNNADAGTTIINGGSVTATGGNYGAGIGGALNSSGGFVEINGGVVIATGGGYAAGLGSGREAVGACGVTVSGGAVAATGGFFGAAIGGGYGAVACPVTVTGGTVTATGGTSGAGIGGGANRPNAPVLLAGGTISATGGARAAGVGGGYLGYLTSVTVGEGADLTAIGGPAASDVAAGSAIGSDSVGALSNLGVVRVAGKVTVPSGVLTVSAGSLLTVTPTGVITGAGSMVGPGDVTNLGAIELTTVAPELAITGNNFLVTFDRNFAGAPSADAVRVYASTFDKGSRALPPIVRTGWTLTKYAGAPDGSGTAFTTSTVLTGDRTVYAVWKGAATLSLTPPSTLKAGKSSTFKVTLAKTSGGPTAKPTGTVRVYYSSTKYVSTTFSSSSSSTKSVTVPALKKGLRTFTVKYLGSSTYAAKTITVTKTAV